MKKKILSTLMTLVLLLGVSLVFNACTKNNTYLPEAKPANNIQSTAESILSDTLFTNLVQAFITESTILHKDNTNTSLIEQSNIRITERIVYFIMNQKDFSKLNTLDRNKVLLFMADSLKSETYLMSNNVIFNNINSLKIFAASNMIQSNIVSKIKTEKISPREVVDCFISTVINSLGFYSEVFDEIGGLMKIGAPTSFIISHGFNFIKNNSPWWKIAAIALQFSNCLYNEL
jgi:hypothetical protein